MHEDRPEPFGNFPVERNYLSVLDESNDRLGVDNLALHHGVGDAGQLDDLRSDRLGGLLEGLEDIDDTENPVVGRIGELDHGEFDDLGARDIEACRFDVDGDADPRATVWAQVRGIRHEAT